MGSKWTDPDVAKHVEDEEDSLNMSLFQDKFQITDSNTIATTDKKFTTRRNQSHTVINMYHPSMDKFFELLDVYRDKVYKVPKDVKYRYKALLHSYDRFRRTDYYPFLLAINSLYTNMEYQETQDTTGVNMIDSSTITNIFSRILTDGNTYKNVKEVNNEEDITKLMQMIYEDSIKANYNMSMLIADKLGMTVREIQNMVKSPIINKYLCKSLNIFFTSSVETDTEVLYKALVDYLNKIVLYKENTDEN